MGKVHMTPDGPKPCKATKRPCKYGEHFDSMKEAEKAFAEQNTPKTLKKDKYSNLDMGSVDSIVKHFPNSTIKEPGNYYNLGNWENAYEMMNLDALEKLAKDGIYSPHELGLDKEETSEFYDSSTANNEEEEEYEFDEYGEPVMDYGYDTYDRYTAPSYSAPPAFQNLSSKQNKWKTNSYGFGAGIIREEDLDPQEQKLLHALQGRYNKQPKPLFTADKPFALVEISSDEFYADPDKFKSGGAAELITDDAITLTNPDVDKLIKEGPSDFSFTIVALGGLNDKGLVNLHFVDQ